MSQIAIRKSGGANIVSLPKAVLKSLGLETGSTLELSINNNQIILTPTVNTDLSLKSLLDNSPSELLAATAEDIAWSNCKPAGKEV